KWKVNIKMKNILLIGGDARSLEVIRTLHESGYEVSIIGFDEYDFTEISITRLPASHTDFSSYDCIILPVDGVSENGEINCPYSTTTFSLTEEMITDTPKHCKILSGIANDYLRKITKSRQLDTIFS